MSILARLLSTASSNSSNNTLNSNLEDQFTINLLFPGPDLLDHGDQIFPLKSDTTIDHSSVEKFDLNTEFNLQERDVRVIIMQEATSLSDSAHLLYDSHVSSSGLTEKQDTRLPKTKISSSPSSQPLLLTAQKSCPEITQRHTSRPRASSNFNRPSQQFKIASNNETEFQRSRREYREEVATFSNCIFGNSDILSYKGTGTKVHILPLDTRVPTVASSHVVEGSSSSGRTGVQGRKLSKSLTSDRDHIPVSTSGVFSPKSTNAMPERKKILITRMFPVPLTKDLNCNNPTSHPTGSKHENRNAKPKQNRTPMFAIGLVIKIPLTSVSFSASSSVSDYHGSGSLIDQDASSSPYSVERLSWKKYWYEHGSESTKPFNFPRDSSQIDILARNWDVIVRTLTHLQAVSTVTISPMLMQALLGSTGLSRELNFSKKSPSIAIPVERMMEEKKPIDPFRSSTKMVQLAPNCLMLLSEKLNRAVETSRQRIVTGIKAKKVVTGQGRWGIWRDQARVVYGWLDKKDQDFMHILLSAFLGNHTDWVMEMSAVWDRQKSCHHQKDKLKIGENFNLPSRTVIISNNKVLARRLIFLLSSFLPSRHSTNMNTFQCLSAPISSCANYTSPSSSATPICPRDSFGYNVKKSAGVNELYLSRSPGNKDGWIRQNYSSDKESIFPVPGSDLKVFKSSASTASTASSVTSLPYFSTCRYVKEIESSGCPEKMGSLASDDLLRLKKKSTMNETSYRNKTLDWRNMINGIYSSSRLAYSGLMNSGTTAPSAIINKHDRTLSKSTSMLGMGYLMGTRRRSIVDMSASMESSTRNLKTKTILNEELTSLPSETIPCEPADILPRVPNPLGSYESPIKASINKDDGVIDIDVPLLNILHSENVVSSPSTFGDLSCTDSGCSEYIEHTFEDRKVPNDSTNVAGWLPHFSPDVVIQAVPGYHELIEDMKACLKSEPAPPANHKNLDNWVDIGSVVIADTRNLTIKRLLYRRMAGSQEIGTDPHPDILGSRGDFYPTHSSTCWSDKHTVDCFVEETLSSAEEKLAETVRRLIYPNCQVEAAIPKSSMRTPQHPGILTNLSGSTLKEYDFHEHKIEIPRNECKHTILTTLEEIVEEIIETRSKGIIGNEKSFLRSGVMNRLSVANNNL